MESLGSLLLFFAAAFAVAFAVCWLVVTVTVMVRRRMDPLPGSILRLRAAGGVYRSQLVATDRSNWTITAPLQRDSYVPLRIGEDVLVEAAGDAGALIFRSRIMDRQQDPHALVIARPARIHKVERRHHRRWAMAAGKAVRIEGEAGWLIDLAEGGAKLRTDYRTRSGDRVRIDLPWGEIAFAWVLASDGSEMRVRFEELLDPSGKIETAPVA